MTITETRRMTGRRYLLWVRPRPSQWLISVLVTIVMTVVTAHAAVVTHCQIPVANGVSLRYTLTLPDGGSRYPVVITYDPYAAGEDSDTRWSDAGYAMLGVNFRGTGCSQGDVFRPLDAEQWGQDGAAVVDWAASQDWSTGNVGMFGYSFTGVSQLATAAFADSHLKAIAPWNVFVDFYRDISYPGGIPNSFIPLWIVAGRQYVGKADFQHLLSEPRCIGNLTLGNIRNAYQVTSVTQNSYIDSAWSTGPDAYIRRVHIPVLGCGNWQDQTVYSRATSRFEDDLDHDITWFVGGDGTHNDCPIPFQTELAFFDHYLKGDDNGWQQTPHVRLFHEGNAGLAPAWETDYPQWSDMDAAISSITLHLHSHGHMDTEAPTADEAPQHYAYPTSSAETPTDWTLFISHWNDPQNPSGVLRFTTPVLSQDVEFLGSGSVNLWMSSTATDSDVQVTLSEIRPDGQAMYVENCWLRLSHRELDATQSTPLRPVHTDTEADSQPLTPGVPVLARIQMRPFNHVFRAGSAIRLEIDTPGAWFTPGKTPATNSIYFTPAMDSQLVLGRVNGGTAHTPLPACDSLLNQPCRANTTPVPDGSLDLATVQAVDNGGGSAGGAASGSGGSGTGRGAGAPSPLLLATLRRRRIRLVGLAVTVALSTMLAGCGSSSPVTQGPGGNGNASAPTGSCPTGIQPQLQADDSRLPTAADLQAAAKHIDTFNNGYRIAGNAAEIAYIHDLA